MQGVRGLACIGLLLACAAAAAQVSGRVELSAQGRALRSEAASEVVVYFRPATPRPVQPLADAAEMETRRKQFDPRALPITLGTRVRFPNADPILHNVFSAGPRERFDLGVYGAGEARSHTFDQPGLVRVYCNVHHDMVGHILVLDTPWFARPDSEGRFALDVPEGVDGELFAWHERAPLWRRKLQGGGEPVEIALDLNRPRVPPHMNKFGKPYGSDRRSGY